MLKVLRSKAFNITFFPFWHEEMRVSAPFGGTNLPSRVFYLSIAILSWESGKETMIWKGTFAS